MRLFLSGLDLIGFMGLSISAALVASVLSLLELTLNASLRWKEQALKALRRARLTEIVSMTRTRKNGSSWIVVRLWRFSFLVGVKE